MYVRNLSPFPFAAAATVALAHLSHLVENYPATGAPEVDRYSTAALAAALAILAAEATAQAETSPARAMLLCVASTAERAAWLAAIPTTHDREIRNACAPLALDVARAIGIDPTLAPAS